MFYLNDNFDNWNKLASANLDEKKGGLVVC